VRMRGKKLIDKTMYPHTNAYAQAWVIRPPWRFVKKTTA